MLSSSPASRFCLRVRGFAPEAAGDRTDGPPPQPHRGPMVGDADLHGWLPHHDVQPGAGAGGQSGA